MKVGAFWALIHGAIFAVAFVLVLSGVGKTAPAFLIGLGHAAVVLLVFSPGLIVSAYLIAAIDRIEQLESGFDGYNTDDTDEF